MCWVFINNKEFSILTLLNYLKTDYIIVLPNLFILMSGWFSISSDTTQHLTEQLFSFGNLLSKMEEGQRLSSTAACTVNSNCASSCIQMSGDIDSFYQSKISSVSLESSLY